MRNDFETWIAGLVDDDGSGTTGTIANKAFFNTQMGLVDDAINTTGGLITADTIYYVATTGSDTTGDGSVTAPWATPAKALSELGNYRVQEGKTLAIQCDDGVYSFSSPITNLPKGFLLTGKNTYTKSMVSVQSSSGSAGAWSVVINLDNVTSVTTADYVIISAASGGTNPKYIEGCWDITAVDAVNNRITVATSHRGASAPSSTVVATVTVLKTIFAFVGSSGVSLINAAGGTISKCALIGDNTANMNGISLENSSLYADTVGINNFGYIGISASLSSTFRATGMIAVSKSGNSGFYSVLSSLFYVLSGVSAGNTYHGIQAINSGIIRFVGTITGNGSCGVASQRKTLVDVTGAAITGNTTLDVFAERYGYVHAVGATIAGSTSPAANTHGNEYGYIDT